MGVVAASASGVPGVTVPVARGVPGVTDPVGETLGSTIGPCWLGPSGVTVTGGGVGKGLWVGVGCNVAVAVGLTTAPPGVAAAEAAGDGNVIGAGGTTAGVSLPETASTRPAIQPALAMSSSTASAR